MKSDRTPNDPKKTNPKGKPPAATPPDDEIVELGELPEVEGGSGEISRSQASGPLSGASVVTWDQLMRAKSEADIHLDFDSLPDVEIDAASDRDLLKNMKFDEPQKSSLEHSAPVEEFAEIGDDDSNTAAKPGGDYSESSIFAQSGKFKRDEGSEVDLLGSSTGGGPSSLHRQQKTDEIVPPKIHVPTGEDVTDELGAAVLRQGDGSAVDLGSSAMVDLPFPMGGDSAAKMADSSRRRRAKLGGSANLEDSGAVDLMGSAAGIPNIPGFAGSARRQDSNLPSTRRVESSGGRATGWIGGGIVGALATVAVCVGVWLTGVLTPRETVKPQPTVVSQPPPVEVVPQVGLNAALVLLDVGDLDRAVEQLDKVEKTNTEARIALGQARVLKYLRDCKQKSAQPDLAAEDLKTAQADLKSAETPTASLWLGLIEESFGKSDAARAIYQDAYGKFGKDAKIFQAALDRLDAQPTGPSAPKITFNNFGAALFTLLIQAEPAVPEEAGFEFWKALRLAKQHKYSEAQTALKQARESHDARRILLAGKRLNPTSDPLEETFLRCCNELRDYWTMRDQLYKGNESAKRSTPIAAFTQTLTDGRNASETVKTLTKRLDDVKDALSQSGYDLNDLPAAVEKFVKAKDTVESKLKAAQADKVAAESRQQAAMAQITQAEAAKTLVEEELKKTRDQMAAMKPATSNDGDVAKLRDERQKLDAKAKELEDQLASSRQSAERSQNTARELTNFVTAVKQKIQSPPEARPSDVLTNLDRALAAKPMARADLPPVPTAAAISDPRSEQAFARGLTNIRAGNIAAAEVDFAAAVQLNGLDARYWYFLGLTKTAQGRDASEDYKQGAERERRNLPNAGTIDASLERLPADARLVINRARGRN